MFYLSASVLRPLEPIYTRRTAILDTYQIGTTYDNSQHIPGAFGPFDRKFVWVIAQKMLNNQLTSFAFRLAGSSLEE